VAPNINGLLETSLTLLLPTGAPGENPGVVDGAEGGLKLNRAFLSAAAGSVLGAAP
jgi:hypothetical protein